METKELKIQAPEGYEIDRENSTFEKIVFKKVKNELPKSWEELKIMNGFYVSTGSNVQTFISHIISDNNKNMFPTRAEAEACLALAQLCQLRDRYNDGWKPDWKDFIMKPCIFFHNETAKTGSYRNERAVLYFKTEELRDKFLENFRDLIETAKPLL